MREFIDEEGWRRLDEQGTASSLAVRRSLELTEAVDLEEVMYLLDALAEMSREAPVAAPFLPRFTKKHSMLEQLLNFDKAQHEARRAREELRRLIYWKCSNFDRGLAQETYSRLLRSLYEFCQSNVIYIATTNYDRVIEHLWEEHPDDGLHRQAPSFDLQTGFYSPTYGSPVLDIQRSYQPPGQETTAVVRLIKLHGSLGWREYQPGRVEETRAREYPEDYAVLAYPLRTDKSRQAPFDQLYGAFDGALASSNFIIIIGLSLRDEAIVTRLADALRAGRKRALIIDPEPEVVRNRLPAEVRKYVATRPGRFATEISLASAEEWRQIYEFATTSRGNQIT
jgi:hypothetical protein